METRKLRNNISNIFRTKTNTEHQLNINMIGWCGTEERAEPHYAYIRELKKIVGFVKYIKILAR